MFILITIILFLIVHIIIHSHHNLALRNRKPAIYAQRKYERFKMAVRITLVLIELIFSLYMAALILRVSTAYILDLNALWLVTFVFAASFTFPVQLIADKEHTAVFFESNLTNTRWKVHLINVDTHFKKQHYLELSEILALGLQTNIDYIELSSPMFQRNKQNRNTTRLEIVAKDSNYKITHDQNDKWVYHLLAVIKILFIQKTQKNSSLHNLNPTSWRTIRLTPNSV